MSFYIQCNTDLCPELEMLYNGLVHVLVFLVFIWHFIMVLWTQEVVLLL